MESRAAFLVIITHSCCELVCYCHQKDHSIPYYAVHTWNSVVNPSIYASCHFVLWCIVLMYKDPWAWTRIPLAEAALIFISIGRLFLLITLVLFFTVVSEVLLSVSILLYWSKWTQMLGTVILWHAINVPCLDMG